MVAGRPATSPRRVLATAIGLGAVGYAVSASLYFSALQLMDASLLSLILYTYPVLVTVTAVLAPGAYRAASRPIPATPTKFVPPSTRPGANGEVARQADAG